MCWNRLEIVSIPSILDSDKTENVSRASRTSMICKDKDEMKKILKKCFNLRLSAYVC